MDEFRPGGFQFADAADIVHIDVRRQIRFQTIKRGGRVVPGDDRGLLFLGRMQHGVQNPAQPCGDEMGVGLGDETAGAERNDGGVLGTVSPAVGESLHARLVDRVTGHAHAAIHQFSGDRRRHEPRIEVGGSGRAGRGAVQQAQVPGAAGVPRVVADKVPRLAIGQTRGGEQDVDGRIVQPPRGQRAKLLAQDPVQVGRIVHVAGGVAPHGVPGRPGLEDISQTGSVDLNQSLRRDAGRHGGGQQGAGGSSRHERKRLARGPLGGLLELQERQGGDDSTNSAAIEGKNVSALHGCPYTAPAVWPSAERVEVAGRESCPAPATGLRWNE